jgi:hypothetical protein
VQDFLEAQESAVSVAAPTAGLAESCSGSASSSVPMLPPINGKDSVSNIHQMLSKWELEDRVPQTVKQRQKDEIEDVYQAKLQKLQAAAQQCINEHVADAPQLDFDSDPEFTDLRRFFPAVLDSIAKEHNYTRTQLNVVEPVIYHLGNTVIELPVVDDDEAPQHIVSRDECAIFPFAEQVRAVLSNADLYEAMQAFRRENSQGSHDAKIRSFYDGAAWRTSPFFTLHRDAHVLNFYYDDVTMTNPIGQYKCKVGFFYYSFLDLGPAYSGKDTTIFVALLAWENHLSNEEYLSKMLAHPQSIFQQLQLFTRDVGCNLQTAYGVQKVHMDILECSADGPAASFLVGRNKTFTMTVHKPCRLCGVTVGQLLFFVPLLLIYLAEHAQQVWRTLPTKIPYKLLTADEDATQRAHLSSLNKTQAAKYMTATGLRQHQCFLQFAPHLPLHNVCPHDGMHVWLEGVLKFMLYLTFHWMNKELCWNLELVINLQLTEFNYLAIEISDKPGKILASHLEGKEPEKGGKIKQTAGQMLVLARNFMPMFGPLIWSKGYSDHPKWQCCVQLLMIFWSLMAAEFTVPELLEIELMIEVFYGVYTTAWGEEMALPKHHWMLHGPLDIFLYGPMRHWWCMRFEAKHQW